MGVMQIAVKTRNTSINERRLLTWIKYAWDLLAAAVL